MSEQVFLDLLKDTIFLVLLISSPILLVALVVGLLISLFQAVTQIQEATLTFVPKIILSLFALIAAAPWMLSVYMSYAQRLLQNMQTMT